MRLKQTHLDYLADIVCAIDSTFASRTKLQRSPKLILGGGRWISHGILKRKFRQSVICRLIGRGVRRRSVQFSKSRAVIPDAERVELENRARIKCVSGTVCSAHGNSGR